MNKRKLRRVAIVALVLVLLCNTLGVQASTKKDDPTVIVKDYGSLYTAIAEAKDNDVIGIQGTITIPAIVDLNMSENKAVILRRMEAGAKLVVSGDYGADNRASFRMISFDGNSTEVSGTEPFVEINGNAYFSMCDFTECFNQSDNGGAINISSGEVELSSCSFDENSASYGSHIFNSGSTTDNSQHNSTTNNSSSVGGNTTNSSSVSNTDNSRSESSRTENSNNSSTVNNYYQQDKQEPATASTNASQPVNVKVPVTVSTPEAKGSDRATTEAPESTSIADKNINIEAKGVDVKLEITGDSYNISISAPEGQESQIQPVNEVSTVNAPESTTEPQRSPNWIEYITVILLAVLVGLEIKDKLHKEK